MQIWVPRGKLLLWLTWRCIAELGLDTVDLSKNTVDLSRDTVDLAATSHVGQADMSTPTLKNGTLDLSPESLQTTTALVSSSSESRTIVATVLTTVLAPMTPNLLAN